MQSTLNQTYDQEPLIPDCCNLGVMFRILLALNGVVLAGLWSRGEAYASLLMNYVESSALIVLLGLPSLVLLCACRRYAYRHPMPDFVQRSLCVLVPGLVAMVLLGFLGGSEWWQQSYPHLSSAFLLVFCMACGAFFQGYFEWRARIYSPSLVEARLQALQARIRPHFLFNSLNTVLSLIRSEPRRAEQVLEDLSDLFRALMRDTRNIVSLDDEIRLGRQYLAIEAVRLGGRLQVEWDIQGLSDAALRAVQIPALLLQPLLENAVHHGVEPSAQPATIEITIVKKLDKIEICISNPVQGEQTSGNQMALQNIRERMRLLYDVEAAVKVESSVDRFTISLIFPAQR